MLTIIAINQSTGMYFNMNVVFMILLLNSIHFLTMAYIAVWMDKSYNCLMNSVISADVRSNIKIS